jgi:ATP-binding protein involved in chromosome partitioning
MTPPERRMKTYHDIAGDGGSRVIEQVLEQRARIRERLAGIRHLLAVGSGKGGVGKSTLALQLAAALAGRGAKVAIFDADLNGPCQARLSGVGISPLVPQPEGLALPLDRRGIGVASLGSLVPEGDPVSFESVSEGDTHTWRATREFALIAQLLGSVAWGELDFLVIDLPPGAERTQQFAEFLGPRVAFLLVSIPSDVARGVVARSISALAEAPNRILGYVENMSGYYCEGCREIRALFPSSHAVELGLPCLGRVPFDAALAALSERGGSILDCPRRPVSAAIQAVAARVEQALERES